MNSAGLEGEKKIYTCIQRKEGRAWMGRKERRRKGRRRKGGREGKTDKQRQKELNLQLQLYLLTLYILHCQYCSFPSQEY